MIAHYLHISKIFFAVCLNLKKKFLSDWQTIVPDFKKKSE